MDTPFYRGKTEALDRTATHPASLPQGSRFFLLPQLLMGSVILLTRFSIWDTGELSAPVWWVLRAGELPASPWEF